MTNLKKVLNVSFEEVVERVQNALKEQGFDILTEIDVKETLKKKLNVNYPKYKILGACSPSLVKKALDTDKEVGTMLSCNVIVYEITQGVQISIQRPIEMIKILENEKPNEVAEKAEVKLQKVIENL
ncbi:MAG: DUF302 domain-containing protein [Candidatus Bathyarchaeota archaeon]|nr:DUF302 domain-containing protein [Candidatus Bathyarchaeota archaeon]